MKFVFGRIKSRRVGETPRRTACVHNVTISRILQGTANQWKDSTSFGRDDLPLVMKSRRTRLMTGSFNQSAADG
jgi:hypothetical protein